ncbi:hypothetical protein PR048_024579 [Dryococelus australis]|uniref:Uncharacterized protein n=1 Tax=Dryococelus australis TaxID=614101 RepID=A0ABQ9GNZ7_9NEOP|nr:hypothetical protein PR048_024579 [Dryococelus australis]
MTTSTLPMVLLHCSPRLTRTPRWCQPSPKCDQPSDIGTNQDTQPVVISQLEGATTSKPTPRCRPAASQVTQSEENSAALLEVAGRQTSQPRRKQSKVIISQEDDVGGLARQYRHQPATTGGYETDYSCRAAEAQATSESVCLHRHLCHLHKACSYPDDHLCHQTCSYLPSSDTSHIGGTCSAASVGWFRFTRFVQNTFCAGRFSISDDSANICEIEYDSPSLHTLRSRYRSAVGACQSPVVVAGYRLAESLEGLLPECRSKTEYDCHGLYMLVCMGSGTDDCLQACQHALSNGIELAIPYFFQGSYTIVVRLHAVLTLSLPSNLTLSLCTANSWRHVREQSRHTLVSRCPCYLYRRPESAPSGKFCNCGPRNREETIYKRTSLTNGASVAERLARSPRHQGSIHGWITPGFSHVEIVPDDAAGRRIFSGISRLPRPCIPTLLHSHLVSYRPSRGRQWKTSASARVEALRSTEHTTRAEISTAASFVDERWLDVLYLHDALNETFAILSKIMEKEKYVLKYYNSFQQEFKRAPSNINPRLAMDTFWGREILGCECTFATIHQLVSDWLKHVLVGVNCLRANHEDTLSESRNPEWLGQMRKRHQSSPLPVYHSLMIKMVVTARASAKKTQAYITHGNRFAIIAGGNPENPMITKSVYTVWHCGSESIVYIQNSITPLDCQRIKEYVTLSEDCEASIWSGGGRGTSISSSFRRTRQKVKSKYRNRIRLERASQKQSSDTYKTPYDIVKRCRELKKINQGVRARQRRRIHPACLPPRRYGYNPRPGHSGFSHVGIVPDDAIGRRVFSGISRHCSIFTSITLIVSQDLDCSNAQNQSTPFSLDVLAEKQVSVGARRLVVRSQRDRSTSSLVCD